MILGNFPVHLPPRDLLAHVDTDGERVEEAA